MGLVVSFAKLDVHCTISCRLLLQVTVTKLVVLISSTHAHMEGEEIPHGILKNF